MKMMTNKSGIVSFVSMLGLGTVYAESYTPSALTNDYHIDKTCSQALSPIAEQLSQTFTDFYSRYNTSLRQPDSISQTSKKLIDSAPSHKFVCSDSDLSKFNRLVDKMNQDIYTKQSKYRASSLSEPILTKKEPISPDDHIEQKDQLFNLFKQNSNATTPLTIQEVLNQYQEQERLKNVLIHSYRVDPACLTTEFLNNTLPNALNQIKQLPVKTISELKNVINNTLPVHINRPPCYAIDKQLTPFLIDFAEIIDEKIND